MILGFLKAPHFVSGWTRTSPPGPVPSPWDSDRSRLSPSRLGLSLDRSESHGLGTGPGGLVRVHPLTKWGAFKNPKIIFFFLFYLVESEGNYLQIVFQASNIIKSIYFLRSSLPKNPTTIDIKEGFFIS